MALKGRQSSGKSALGTGNFRTFFFGQVTSDFGSRLGLFAMPFAALQAGHGASGVSAVLAARSVPTVALLLLGGLIGDRLPRRLVMLCSDALRSLTQGGAAVLLLVHHAPLSSLVAAQALYGVGEAFFLPSTNGLVKETVGTGDLQRANSLLSISRNFSRTLGPLVAGLLVAAWSPGWALAIDSATFALSVASLWLVRIPPRLVPLDQDGLRQQLRTTARLLRTRGWLAGLLFISAIFQFAVLAPWLVLGPTVAQASLGGAQAWGLVLSISGTGGLVGGLSALRWHPRRYLLITALLVLTQIPAPLTLALSHSLLLVAAAGCLSMFGLSLIGVFYSLALQEGVPDQSLTTVSSVDLLGSMALLPMGYLITGSATPTLGITPILLTSAGVPLLCTAILISIPSIRSAQRGRLGGTDSAVHAGA